MRQVLRVLAVIGIILLGIGVASEDFGVIGTFFLLVAIVVAVEFVLKALPPSS